MIYGIKFMDQEYIGKFLFRICILGYINKVFIFIFVFNLFLHYIYNIILRFQDLFGYFHMEDIVFLIFLPFSNISNSNLITFIFILGILTVQDIFWVYLFYIYSNLYVFIQIILFSNAFFIFMVSFSFYFKFMLITFYLQNLSIFIFCSIKINKLYFEYIIFYLIFYILHRKYLNFFDFTSYFLTF